VLQLELLWKLQEIDQEMNASRMNTKNRETRGRLNEIKKICIGINKDLNSELEEFELAKKKAAKLDIDLKYYEQKIKDDDLKLYKDGLNIKAIDNVQKEIESFKQKADSIEDEILKNMEKCESLKESMEAKKKKLAVYKDEVQTLKEKYMDDSKKSKKSLDELNRKRESIIKEIDPTLIKQYNDIASSKANPVSAVVNGICTECGVHLNALALSELKSDNKVCRCQYCNRILYNK
jgi:predicted  nucleic acid-binding Zn-ribbon protein